MTSRLIARLDRLEGKAPQNVPVRDAIDRPPRETRAQWLARRAGKPDLSLVNSRGENHEHWVARRLKELDIATKGDAGEHPSQS
jgi:hypothetical protein